MKTPKAATSTTTPSKTTPQTADEMIAALKASIAATKPRIAVCGTCGCRDGFHFWTCPGARIAVQSGNYTQSYNYGREAFRADAAVQS